MSWLHRHDWEYWANSRLELHGKTFMINLHYCQCGEWKARASDMQPYLDLKTR